MGQNWFHVDYKTIRNIYSKLWPLYWHVGQISWLISLSWKFGVRTHFFQSSVQFQKQLRNSGKQFQSDKHFEIHFGIRRRVNINSVMQESTDDLTFRHVQHRFRLQYYSSGPLSNATAHLSDQYLFQRKKQLWTKRDLSHFRDGTHKQYIFNIPQYAESRLSWLVVWAAVNCSQT